MSGRSVFGLHMPGAHPRHSESAARHRRSGIKSGHGDAGAGAAAAIGAVAVRRITRPLRELNAMASKFSDGDLTARSAVTDPTETQTLAAPSSRRASAWTP
ncbi:HAMP domain-containing protein [Kutzneria buriramensis]|uniref:HAMP domain-containing protein n=1 Tax=Streptomyces sp. NL15-2K TaxID=376149 RepID=UPI0026F2F354|nr:HAMP domain-containing protein [Kutzneria buriramensis]WKX11281.1 HAMP domain-containing protein [Kutzneria buriramensis]